MTTRPLQVLLLESHPSEGVDVAASLAAAGHEVVRCHAPLSHGFPCLGLVDRDACPLRAGIDVAVDVRRAAGTEPTALEDGVILRLIESIGGTVTRHAEAVDYAPDAPLPATAFEFEFPSDTTMMY